MKTTMDWTIRVVIAALIVAAGCDDSAELSEVDTPPPPGLVSSAEAPIADVLIPTGFSLVESRSIHHARGNAVIVDHYYVGSTSKSEVLAAYRA